MVRNTDNSCGFGGDMLCYLFNEMAEPERDLFELHLVECDSCTDEFAALSQTRYPVYEWKKLEFDPMTTPEFVIPMKQANTADSWVEKIRVAFAFSSHFSMAAAGFAFIVVTITGIAWLNFDFGKIDIAANNIENRSTELDAFSGTETAFSKLKKDSEDPLSPVSLPSRDRNERNNISAHHREHLPNKAVVVKRSTPINLRDFEPKSASTVHTKSNVKLPALQQFNEIEDDSLRLAELFNDIDTFR